MICQDCGVEATTKYVEFYQNIGLLVVRFPSSIRGSICKSCIHKHFWKMTVTTLFLGWWGMISLIFTPFYLLNNVGRYLFCLGMKPVPADAGPPILSDEAIERLTPFMDELFKRLNDGEELQAVTDSIAEEARVTPGQVVLFLRAVIQSQKQQ
jgi:hypothetical protein